MSDSTACPKSLREIQEALRAILPELETHHGVKSLGVFGSYVRGEQGIGSDLDLLVEFTRAPTIFEFTRLQRLLAAKLELEVDLVMKSALKPTIGKQILGEVLSV